MSLSGNSINTTIWDDHPNASAAHVDFERKYTKGADNGLGADQLTSFTFYPWSNSAEVIETGQTYNYVIDFANGQSVSGSLIAE